MKLKRFLLLTLLLCGCGQTLQQSQILTLPPSQGTSTPLPDRTFAVSNGQVSRLVFTPDAFYNGINPPVTTLSTLSGTLVVNSNTNNQLTLALREGARTLSFGVLNGPNQLVAGQLYAPFFNDVGPGSFLNLEDLSAGRKSWIQIATTTGGLTIVSLSDTAIEVDFSFIGVQKNFHQGSGTALGNFDVSGHLTATLTPL
jgi:hypothetical protein